MDSGNLEKWRDRQRKLGAVNCRREIINYPEDVEQIMRENESLAYYWDLAHAFDANSTFSLSYLPSHHKSTTNTKISPEIKIRGLCLGYLGI